MLCPKCGYALSAFDPECPRCLKFGGARRDTPGTGLPQFGQTTSTPAISPSLHDAGALIPPRPPFVASRVLDIADRLPQPEITPDTITIMPRRAAQAGALDETPQTGATHQSTQSAGAGTLPADRPSAERTKEGSALDDLIVACGACGSQSTQRLKIALNTDTHGGARSKDAHRLKHTSLGARLSAPVEPALVTSWARSATVSVTGYSLAIIAGALGSVLGPAIAMVTAVVSTLAIRRDALANEQAITLHQDRELQWRAAIHTWERLFYCDRCESLTHAMSGDSAPVQDIRKMLYAPARLKELPPAEGLDLLTSPPDPDRLTVQAGAGGLTLAVAVAILYSVQVAGHREMVKRIAAMRATTIAQTDQSLANADEAIAAAQQVDIASALLNSEVAALQSAKDRLMSDMRAAKWNTEEEAQASAATTDADASEIRSAIAAVRRDLHAHVSPGGGAIPTQTPPVIQMRTKAGGGPDPGPIDFP